MSIVVGVPALLAYAYVNNQRLFTRIDSLALFDYSFPIFINPLTKGVN